MVRGPIIISLAACVIGAVIEGLFAGTQIKERLASIRMPRYAPPFWLWVLIGVGYYATCFAVSIRLLMLPASAARATALILLGTIMFVNALWNYFFFRTRDFRQAYLLGVVYSALALVLFLLATALDRPAAWFLCPYIVYLFYANAWGYRVWKLNSGR